MIEKYGIDRVSEEPITGSLMALQFLENRCDDMYAACDAGANAGLLDPCHQRFELGVLELRCPVYRGRKIVGSDEYGV